MLLDKTYWVTCPQHLYFDFFINTIRSLFIEKLTSDAQCPTREGEVWDVCHWVSAGTDQGFFIVIVDVYTIVLYMTANYR